MKYYIIENEAPVGPFELGELVGRGLRPTDLVWTEGMADWAPAETIEEVRMALYGPKTGDVPASQGPATPAPGTACPPPPARPVAPAPEYQQPQYQQQYPQQPYQQQQYQQPYQQQQPMLPPDNYLAWAIIVTILCCLPFGIVAIIKAASVNTLWNAGNYEQAYEASAAAKKWVIISAIVGVVSSLVYAGFMIFSGVMSAL